jgi:acetyltransferase-like isoleucine patch superfamily enzyme
MTNIYRDFYKPVIDSHPIHPETRFGENVRLGDNVVIDEGCSLGANVFIGHNTVIRSNVKIGDNSVIGHLVVIEKDTIIGEKVTIQSQCHITGGAVISDLCFFGPGVVTSNTKHISHGRKFEVTIEGPFFEKACRIGAGTVFLPGVIVGRECVIGAGSLVINDCEPGYLYLGRPAYRHRRIPYEEYLT